MATPYGIKLAVYLVSTHFGDVNAKVCECLLRRGTLTLNHITTFTELTKENVRRALLVLIHQNCVQAFAMQQQGGFGSEPKRPTTYYTALFDNIIHRLRFPKFVEIVSQELGKECVGVGIFEGLLQHGRMSINQIIDRHKQTSNKGKLDEEAIRESFSKLVDARFVERCPAPMPILAPPVDEDTSARKKAAKAAKVGDKSQTLEYRALADAAPNKSLRFFVEMDDSSDASDKRSDKQSTGSTSGEKRKFDSLESDGGQQGQDKKKKEVLWRANFEEFVRRLRNKICVVNVTSSLDSQAGIVLNAVLELIGRSETGAASGSTDSLSVNDIYDEVIKNEDGLGMDLDSTSSTLSQLESQMLITWADGTYSVDLKNIIRLAQNEEVESIVFKRFGREAYRIFRALSKAGRLLETEKIADQTFVEKRDAIKILYTLWTGEFVHMEKITTSNGNRTTQFSLWKVNEHSLQKHVLDEMYHAVLNLRLRIAHELDQQKELLRLPKESLEEGEKAKDFKRLVKLQIILETSVMDLDDDLMLFSDF